NRERRDAATEQRLLDLRHLVGIRLLHDAPAAPEFAAAADSLPEGDALPEFQGSLTAAQLRAAILRDGCALVRGLVDRDRALRFAGEIDAAFAVRERRPPDTDGYYEEFRPRKPYKKVTGREWVQKAGGLLAIDSPRLNFQFMELLAAAGIPELVSSYLGEPALISMEK